MKAWTVGSGLCRVPVTTFAFPHLAAEPVPVVIKINLHDDVVHLCDPHKPVALQEPRRQCSSVLKPQGGGTGSPTETDPLYLPYPHGRYRVHISKSGLSKAQGEPAKLGYLMKLRKTRAPRMP